MVLPFGDEYKEKFYKLLDEVFKSNFWSDGKMTNIFEEKFQEFTGLYSCAVTSGGAGLLSILEYIDVRKKKSLFRQIRFGLLHRRQKRQGLK